MKQIVTVILLFCALPHGIAQDIPIPLPIRAAREAGTRTAIGLPGNYWQNHSEYKISVTVLPDSNTLSGSEKIFYHNESRDTLSAVVIRLYQNLFATSTPRQFQVNATDLHEGVQISRLTVGQKPVDLSSARAVTKTPTNLIVRLPEPLLPGKTALIEADWSFPISHATQIRMGHYPNGSLFMAYFYPQIAVYDDIDGWDLQEYAGLTEFYNDFSDYDLEIHAPAAFPVWGTGELVNKSEIYTDEIIKKFNLAIASDTLVHIIGEADSLPLRNRNGMVTWHFTASHVPDVCFGMGRNYRWDGVSVIVDPATGRRALAATVYPGGTTGYDRVAQVAAITLKYLSTELPGVPYPYPYSTTFCNGRDNGGMEFPMMTNDGNPPEFANLTGLTFHEIAHTYFPFYMGINERKYAWMDEGWASLLPADVVNRTDSAYGYWQREVKAYLRNAGSEYDSPLIIPSVAVNNPAYRAGSYYRPAMAYYFLRDAMGEENFRNGLKNYMQAWNGKHPVPYDFFAMMDGASGGSLDWFWKPWFFEIAYPDLKIASVRKSGKTLEVEVENTGGLPLPVQLTLTDRNGRKQVVTKSCTCWKGPVKKVIVKIKTAGVPERIQLGDDRIPDMLPADNQWK